MSVVWSIGEGVLGNDQRQTGVGTWIVLRTHVSSPEIWWGPLWAALCGAVAAGAVGEDPSQVLRLIGVLVLADPLVGNLSYFIFGRQGEAFEAHRENEAAEAPPILTLPYTRPGSPGDRLGRWLHRAVGWRRYRFDVQARWVDPGLALQATGVGVLGLLLGEPVAWIALVILLTLVAGALARQIGGGAALVFQALVESGLPWLLGYVAFAPLNSSSLTLAALYALAYWSALRILARETLESAPGVALALAGTVLFLLATKQPILAAGVALVAAFPIASCLSALPAVSSTGGAFLRRIRWYMLAALLLSALSAR